LAPRWWGGGAARRLPESRHVIFRSLGHGVSSQDSCAARLRDEFIDDPNPRWPLPCRADTAPDFTAAAERVKALSARDSDKKD
jgi:TAP-like protein